MYDDPKHIKDNRINARFNDHEAEAIAHIAGLTGMQKSTLVRNATLKLAEELKEEFERNLTSIKDAG